jgi:hypothetical protein
MITKKDNLQIGKAETIGKLRDFSLQVIVVQDPAIHQQISTW